MNQKIYNCRYQVEIHIKMTSHLVDLKNEASHQEEEEQEGPPTKKSKTLEILDEDMEVEEEDEYLQPPTPTETLLTESELQFIEMEENSKNNDISEIQERHPATDPSTSTTTNLATTFLAHGSQGISAASMQPVLIGNNSLVIQPNSSFKVVSIPNPPTVLVHF